MLLSSFLADKHNNYIILHSRTNQASTLVFWKTIGISPSPLLLLRLPPFLFFSLPSDSILSFSLHWSFHLSLSPIRFVLNPLRITLLDLLSVLFELLLASPVIHCQFWKHDISLGLRVCVSLTLFYDIVLRAKFTLPRLLVLPFFLHFLNSLFVLRFSSLLCLASASLQLLCHASAGLWLLCLASAGLWLLHKFPTFSAVNARELWLKICLTGSALPFLSSPLLR